MTIEEYKEELASLTKLFESQKRKLDSNYAMTNKQFAVGQILKNHNATILVDEYKIGRDFNGIPYIVYYGVELKKDLTPKKNGNRESIHGDDGIEVLIPKA